MNHKPLFIAFFSLIVLAGCKEERTPEMNGPHMLSIVSGDKQNGTVDEALLEPIVMQALNIEGTPIEGEDISVTIVSGGGSLGDETLTTNVDGNIEIFWTMGHEAYPKIEIEDGNGFITTIEIDYDPETTMTDPRGDGSVYSITNYCGTYWMTQNVRYETESSEIRAANPDESYGRAYYPIEFARVCPIGWKVPTDKDWMNLEECLGLTDLGDSNEIRGTHGDDMKMDADWDDQTSGADGTGSNSSAFNALPAGIYDGVKFKFFGKQAGFWSPSQDSTETKYLTRFLYYDSDAVHRVGVSQDTALSCRCIKS
ncbi:MAG TPA: hypothetical protein DCX14_10200 [Flavobacteriales bacterium]|nr:hypothetical protein [Flavobacteriales bacterium]